MRLKLAVALVFMISTLSANAGLLIDPYFGVGSIAQKIEVTGIDLPDPDTESSTSIGSRLGYSFILLSAGLDYEMVTAGDAKATNTSLFVGVDLPILFRFWAEYMISSDFESDDDDISRDFTGGYGLGVGFTGLPFVSINLEVQNLNYEYEANGFDVEQSVAATTLSVSLPLDF